VTDTPKKKWTLGWILRRLFLFTAVLIVLTLFAAGTVVFLIYDHVVAPGQPGAKTRFTIPEGATGTRIAKLLEEQGLVEDELFYRMALKLEPGEGVKHGAYTLARGLSPIEVLRTLREGPLRGIDPNAVPDELRITIPEGYTLRQTAALLDDPDSFLAAATDNKFVARLGLDVPSLEGFLMPNTYFFDEKPDGEALVERMLSQFETEYTTLARTYPEAEEMNLLDVVTVASLVEEEARDDAERPIIAAVIHNRLKRKMALDMDSTLQYALNKYGQRLLNEDKEVDSPYNTYQNTGLPPGPISSPGVASIEAALRPADVDYLFFVSNADGRTHTFSSTLSEHNRAVAKYRREIAVQRRELNAQQGGS
jgi:UPF0755 protein